MDVLCFLVNFLLAITAQILRHGSKFDGEFDDVKSSSRLKGTVILTINESKPEECLKHCLLNVKCKSININVDESICELLEESHAEDNTTEVEASPGWTHYGYTIKNYTGCDEEKFLNARLNGEKKHCCESGWTGQHCETEIIGKTASSPGDSCKLIKENNPSFKNGFYWINLEEPTKVYCDMETDQGGWLLVANVTYDIGESSTEYTGLVTDGKKLEELGRTASENYRLNGEKFQILRDTMGFSSVRVYCYKPSTGRTFHAVLNEQAANYVTTGVNYDNYCEGKIRFLDDDISNMRNKDCTDLQFDNVIPLYKRAYHNLVYVRSFYHFSFFKGNRFHCDDHFTDSSFDAKGKWYVFLQ